MVAYSIRSSLLLQSQHLAQKPQLYLELHRLMASGGGGGGGGYLTVNLTRHESGF